MLTSARPRTLVLAVWDAVIDVAMIGPRGRELGSRQVLPVTTAPEDLWTAIEQLGEFDRITLIGEDPRGLAAQVASESQRPLRTMSQATLRWGHMIAGEGVEVALALGPRFSASVFFNGTELPGIDLGHQRIRKNWRLREFLAPNVFERKGMDTWLRRVKRTTNELLAVWNPAALYLATPPTLPMPELASPVIVVPARNSFADALRAWDVAPDGPLALQSAAAIS